MLLRLKFFAAAADLAGHRTLDLEMPADSTVADLRQTVAERFPAFASLAGRVMIAVNRQYAQPDHRLVDGDEVALIPPVSGGAGDEADHPAAAGQPGSGAGPWRDASGRYEITFEPIAGDPVAAKVVTNVTGAAVVFEGTVRELTHGRRTLYLEYEAYPEMALEKMAEIGSEIGARWPGAEVAMTHRIGKQDPKEISVVIAVATPHRPAAFEACRYAIDRLKEIVPIWKKEFFEDGSVWVGSEDEHDHC